MKHNDWLPSKRMDQLAMAKAWKSVLATKGASWQITDADIAEFGDLYDDADSWFEQTKTIDRTSSITVRCNAAFSALISFMRNLKARKFFSPPLTDIDYNDLGLNMPDTVKNTAAIPLGMAIGEISLSTPTLLTLTMKHVAGSVIDPKTDYGFQIYYGILPPGGATPEEIVTTRRYLTKVPTKGDDLPINQFTRRRKETLVFSAEDSGKTAYFCIRIENSKGQSGPWGPMFKALIP
jgi:hypothetical protein